MSDAPDAPDVVDPAEGDDRPPRGGSHLTRNVAIAVGLLLAVFIGLLATRPSASERSQSAKIVGRAVPEVSGTTLTGTQVSLDQFRGKWTVVNFFASWCTPCRLEHPELVKFAAAHAAKGDVQVVAVAFQDDPSAVRAFFDQQGGSWPVIVGDTGRIALDFGVTGVPESYLVSPDGLVVAKFEGVAAAALDSVLARAEGQTGVSTP